VHCEMGTKKNAKGYKASWIGCKLHAGVTDCCMPISLALTAASLHGSQAAIPLMKLISARILHSISYFPVRSRSPDFDATSSYPRKQEDFPRKPVFWNSHPRRIRP
jgi:hypothetical protein